MKNKKSIQQLKDEGLVTTADKISMPEKKIIKLNEVGLIWIAQIESYCEEQGITPQDLILSHKEGRKVKKGKMTKESKLNSVVEAGEAIITGSTWFDKYRKAKTGYSPKDVQ